MFVYILEYIYIHMYIHRDVCVDASYVNVYIHRRICGKFGSSVYTCIITCIALIQISGQIIIIH